jgi:hypothetical protein
MKIQYISRKWLLKHLFSPSSCKKQINKQNSYLLLALLQSGSVPELDMHVSKHFLPGQFIQCESGVKHHKSSKFSRLPPLGAFFLSMPLKTKRAITGTTNT